MIFRRGTKDDVERIAVLAENFYEVAGYKDIIPFCADSTKEFITLGIDMQLSYVAEYKDEIVGFVSGVATPFIMNREYLVGAELAWWMEPDYRKGSAGIKLLKHIEQSAKEIGCRMWSMMSLECQDPEKIEKIYLSMKYVKAETTFMRIF